VLRRLRRLFAKKRRTLRQRASVLALDTHNLIPTNPSIERPLCRKAPIHPNCLIFPALATSMYRQQGGPRDPNYFFWANERT
jgi:hypothetical protein